jgi:hypothetical protein
MGSNADTESDVNALFNRNLVAGDPVVADAIRRELRQQQD